MPGKPNDPTGNVMAAMVSDIYETTYRTQLMSYVIV